MISLYVHIPFCQKKCLFCSFVVAVGQEHRRDDYLQSLKIEAEFYKGVPLKTIYIGGGTPSFFHPSQIKALVKIIKDHFPFDPSVEFTIEANPESLDADKAKLIYDLGINRVSLGIQSLNDKYLKFLGRCHTAATAHNAYDLLRKTGFTNINVDLMFSFPRQTDEEIAQDVKAITTLQSEHISLYSLTIEENSRFYIEQMKLGDQEDLARQYQLVTELLGQTEFIQYEISNFAKPGKESQHNLNYWQADDYLGLGVGAHSYRAGERFWNVSRLTSYFGLTQKHALPVEAREKLDPEGRFMENLLIGLRMNQGVNLKILEEKIGTGFPTEKKVLIDEFVGHGLLIYEAPRLRATVQGRLVLDEIASRLI